MDSQQQGGVALTSFDPVTADAVVAVLGRAGLAAWQDPSPDDSGDVLVRVPAGLRDAAMRLMGQRMEEIQAEMASRRPPTVTAARLDPDDPSHGPPLMMERFASMRVLVVALVGPLLVVTIAGPFLPRQARVVIFLVIGAGLLVAMARRRR